MPYVNGTWMPQGTVQGPGTKGNENPNYVFAGTPGYNSSSGTYAPQSPASAPKATVSSPFVAPSASTGWSPSANQSLGNSLGYTGEYGSGGFDNYLKDNPAKYYDYITTREASDPGYQPNLGFNSNINTYLGNQIGYSGDVGGGQLGSGERGVDVLSGANAAPYRSQYEKMRQVFQPGYQWQGHDVGPTDFNEQAYLANNPKVAQMVASGEFTSGLQHYLQEGQAQGLNYTEQQPAWMTQYQQMMDNYTAQLNQLMNPTAASTTPADTALPARPDEMAAPSYLTNDFTGMNDKQKRSHIATEALYGTGADQGLENYYLNLLQRSIEDDSGNVTNWDLLPIETQFLSYMGLPITSGNDFLRGMGNRLQGQVARQAA